jgi:hypothetical protein
MASNLLSLSNPRDPKDNGGSSVERYGNAEIDTVVGKFGEATSTSFPYFAAFAFAFASVPNAGDVTLNANSVSAATLITR